MLSFSKNNRYRIAVEKWTIDIASLWKLTIAEVYATVCTHTIMNRKWHEDLARILAYANSVYALFVFAFFSRISIFVFVTIDMRTWLEFWQLNFAVFLPFCFCICLLSVSVFDFVITYMRTWQEFWRMQLVCSQQILTVPFCFCICLLCVFVFVFVTTYMTTYAILSVLELSVSVFVYLILSPLEWEPGKNSGVCNPLAAGNQPEEDIRRSRLWLQKYKSK